MGCHPPDAGGKHGHGAKPEEPPFRRRRCGHWPSVRRSRRTRAAFEPLEIDQDFPSRLVAQLAILFEGLGDDGFERGRTCRVEEACVRGLAGEHIFEDETARFAVESGAAGGHFIEHRAEGKQIRPLVERQAAHLLGRHVPQCAEQTVRPGGARIGARRFVRPRRVRDFRQTEVEQLGRSAVRDEDVAGFQIAVNDPVRMRGVERVGDRCRQLQKLGQRQRAAREAVAQAFALQKLHHEKRHAAFATHFVNRADVRMVERRRRARLPVESLHRAFIRQECRREELERHLAAQSRVLRAVDNAHAAGADLFDHAVGADGLANHGRPMLRAVARGVKLRDLDSGGRLDYPTIRIYGYMPAATLPLLDTFSALADQTRCRLLLVLERQELTVSELCDVLQLPQSTVSRHLKTLADAAFVSSRRDGTSHYYTLSPEMGASVGAHAQIWQLTRDQLKGRAGVDQDARRLQRVLAGRRETLAAFFRLVCRPVGPAPRRSVRSRVRLARPRGPPAGHLDDWRSWLRHRCGCRRARAACREGDRRGRLRRDAHGPRANACRRRRISSCAAARSRRCRSTTVCSTPRR